MKKMQQLELSQEITTKDQDGNLWMMKLNKPDSKTNRWQLSFFFNDKEFSLAKPQNNQAASNYWELIQKTRIIPKIENQIENEEEVKEEIEEISVSKYKERPRKRTAKI